MASSREDFRFATCPALRLTDCRFSLDSQQSASGRKDGLFEGGPCSQAAFMFGRFLSFVTIPNAFGFEDATRFPLVLLGGSLIPIAVIGMGMVPSARGGRPDSRENSWSTFFQELL